MFFLIFSSFYCSRLSEEFFRDFQVEKVHQKCNNVSSFLSGVFSMAAQKNFNKEISAWIEGQRVCSKSFSPISRSEIARIPLNMQIR